jgi:hypothetical protein
MKPLKAIVLILAIVLTIWSGTVFLNSIDGPVLWKTLASGAGLLGFGILLIVSLLNAIGAGKSEAAGK